MKKEFGVFSGEVIKDFILNHFKKTNKKSLFKKKASLRYRKRFIDSVGSKYRQIYLSQKLIENNNDLERLVAEIELKNKEIEGINSNQQNLIELRTRELHSKNKKVFELSH